MPLAHIYSQVACTKGGLSIALTAWVNTSSVYTAIYTVIGVSGGVRFPSVFGILVGHVVVLVSTHPLTMNIVHAFI